MESRALSKVQRNQVMLLAEALGLQIREFRWDVVGSSACHSNVTVLTHPPTGAYFRFDYNLSNARLYPQWWPDMESGKQYAFCATFYDVMLLVDRWLQGVKREHEAPDIWQLAMQAPALIGEVVPDGTDSERFTAAEQRLLSERIEEIRSHVQSSLLRHHDDEATRRVERKLDALSAALETKSRFDWKNFFITTMLAIALEAGLQTAPAKDFLDFAFRQVTQVYPRVVKQLQPAAPDLQE
jgi:hypothetical protein